MAVERLRWLVWFCNISGLIPVRMILRKSGEFQRFDFNWRHPISWWLIIELLCRLLYLSVHVYVSIMFHIERNVSFPVIYMVAALAAQIGSVVNIISPKLILFHLKNLRTAVESLHQVDRILYGISNKPFYSCTTRLRTAMGVSITVLGVILSKTYFMLQYLYIWVGHSDSCDSSGNFPAP